MTEGNVADAGEDEDEDEDVRKVEGELGWGLGLGIYMGTVLTVGPTRLWCLGALIFFSLGVFTAPPLIPDQGQNWRSGAARDSDRGVLWHIGVTGLAEKHDHLCNLQRIYCCIFHCCVVVFGRHQVIARILLHLQKKIGIYQVARNRQGDKRPV